MTPQDWLDWAKVFDRGSKRIQGAPGMAVAVEIKLALKTMATECEIIAVKRGIEEEERIARQYEAEEDTSPGL